MGGDPEAMPSGRSVDPEWEVTPEEVLRRLAGEGGSIVLIDVRRADEVAIASIEGGIHVPLDQMRAREDELGDAIEAGDDGALVVAYCHHGRRSLVAAATLREMGFGGAVSMAGGIDLWSTRIDPGIARY